MRTIEPIELPVGAWSIRAPSSRSGEAAETDSPPTSIRTRSGPMNATLFGVIPMAPCTAAVASASASAAGRVTVARTRFVGPLNWTSGALSSGPLSGWYRTPLSVPSTVRKVRSAKATSCRVMSADAARSPR